MTRDRAATRLILSEGTNLSAQAPWGYGWIAGAGIGVTIKKISIDITGTYRDVRSPLKLTADYYAIGSAGNSGTATKSSATLESSALLVMRGISIGLNGHLNL